MALPNIFSDKAVGIAFAVAFALWAWYLNSLAGVVLKGVEQIRVDQQATQLQLTQLKAEIVQHQLFAAEVGTRFGERQAYVLEWIKAHDHQHETNGDGR